MLEIYLAKFVGLVWTYPVVGLCLFGGIFFTLRFGFIQIRCFPHAIALVSGKYDDPNEHGQITHFQALSAALSGTIGLGNIAGVAIAIALGGPGAVFWLWIAGFLGMATKYVECALGTHYRDEDPKTGEVRGGPMQYILKGLGNKWWPVAAFFGVTIAFAGMGAGAMFQANQAAAALNYYYSVPAWVTGLVLFSLGMLVMIGGIQRIGKVASRLVPAMCVIYVLGSLLICFMNIQQIPAAFAIIFRDAFTGEAAAGGSVGAVLMMGIRRAIFSNEAGLGSAAIAHAAVKTDYPIREGIVASLGPLIDTVVVCTATALVIILAGNYGTEMYQSVSNQTIDFRTIPKKLYIFDGWKVSGNQIPKESESIRKFKEGDRALAYKKRGKRHSSVVLPPLDISLENIDGIRFSYYHMKGGLQLTVLGKNGSPLGRFSVDKKSNDVSSTGLSLFGQGTQGEWKSAIISFSDAFKANISEDDNIRLQFRPSGSDGAEWYIDRIQPVQKLAGIGLTTTSFDSFLKGFGSIFIALSVFFFAFSTLITWSYYGETAASFVFGKSIILPYKIMFVTAAFIGSINTLEAILNFADGMIGILVIPNMIAIVLLSPKVAEWTKTYFADLKSGKIKPIKQ
ncbi:MAG: AGCS family alanine or glycine:cation symporter [Candidatus Marinamargulisbacteria bacterium]|jgi:AGCS family alanine or glycine:cation symporter